MKLEQQAHLDPEPFVGRCSTVTFAPGETLRVKGRLYPDMFLLTSGEVEVHLDARSGRAPLSAARGAPIGEIGFLTGTPATATVKARTPVTALFIDNPTWRSLEREEPDLAVSFYRQLSDVADGRQSYNLQFADQDQIATQNSNIEIILCQRREDLLEAQRIRYAIYCVELGRTSPYADAVRQTIADELDETGYVLLARERGVPLATLRMNKSRDGGLGLLETIYGMAKSPHHPEATAICTKFIAKKEARLGAASFKLMATAVELAVQHGVAHCFIDCVPSLRPFYASLGFSQSADPFLHRENGRSIPMSLDIARYAKRISRLTGLVARG